MKEKISSHFWRIVDIVAKYGVIAIVIGVLSMLIFSSCAASRKTQQAYHTEQRDSAYIANKDSAHIRATQADTISRTQMQQSYVIGTSQKSENLQERIHELITEHTDSAGNKTTTTDRTTERTADKYSFAFYDRRLHEQEHEIEIMQRTIDSLALVCKTDVGTHWAAYDSLSIEKAKPSAMESLSFLTDNFKKTAKDFFLCFLSYCLFVVIYRKLKEKYKNYGKE